MLIITWAAKTRRQVDDTEYIVQGSKNENASKNLSYFETNVFDVSTCGASTGLGG